MSAMNVPKIQEKTGLGYYPVLNVLNLLTEQGKLTKIKKGLWIKNAYTAAKEAYLVASIDPSDLLPDDSYGKYSHYHKVIPKWAPFVTNKAIESLLGTTNTVTVVGKPVKLQFSVTDTQSQGVPSVPTKFQPSVLQKGAWITKWELESLNLQRECADFYTAYDICSTAEGQGIRNLLLDPIVTRLSKQFANYLDMAIGGELRHCSRRMRNLLGQMSLSPAHDAVLGKAKAGTNRHDMWLEWHEIRQKYGLDALKIARDAFLKGSWSSAFGGKKWGLAASVLVQYLEGEINAVIFVDTVWSLQHNTSWILNKVWQIPGNMKQLLDDKFSGRIEKVVPFSSPELQEAWNFEVKMRQVDENIRRIREEEEQERVEDKKREIATLAGILKAKAKRDAEIQAAKAVQMLAEAQEVLNG